MTLTCCRCGAVYTVPVMALPIQVWICYLRPAPSVRKCMTFNVEKPLDGVLA